MGRQRDEAICPCADCVARTEDCHAMCTDYLVWRVARGVTKAIELPERIGRRAYAEFAYEGKTGQRRK